MAVDTQASRKRFQESVREEVGHELTPITESLKEKEYTRLISGYGYNENSAASNEAAIWDYKQGKERDDLYATMDLAYNDPSSPFYNPYRQATNGEYTGVLSKYGIEVPQTITQDWIDQQLGVYGSYLETKPDGSLAKAKTKQQKIAQALYGLNGLEYTTQKAENELAEIRKTVDWYAKHGYSDEEIARVVGNIKHSTLDSLNITRNPSAYQGVDDDGYNISTKQGRFVQLNRPVYFDDDTLTGMIWKARNGVEDMSDFDAAVYAYRNQGILHGGTPSQQRKRTYGTESYQPYTDGCTDVDAKIALGQDEFTWDDLVQRKAEALQAGDDDLVKIIDRRMKAEDDTANAEKELNDLRTIVRSFNYQALNIPEGKTAKEYFKDYVDSTIGSDEYKTLAKLDKDREYGSPTSLNRSIDYRREDIVDEMVARYNAAHGGTVSNDPRIRSEINPDEKPSGTPASGEGEAQAEGSTQEKTAPETTNTATQQDQYILRFTSGETELTPTQQKQLELWKQNHSDTYTFRTDYLMEMDPRIPTANGIGNRAAGGAMSDVPSGGHSHDRQFMLPTGAAVSESDLSNIVYKVYSGDTADLSDDELKAGAALFKSIPWVSNKHNVEGGSEIGKTVGGFFQAIGLNPFKDISDASDADMTRYLGKDARDVLAAMEDPYATSREKADMTMLLFNAASAASAENVELGQYLQNHTDVLGDLQQKAGVITDRHTQAVADLAEAERVRNEMTLATNIDLLRRVNDPDAQMTDEERASAEQLMLSADEADAYLDAANRPVWNQAQADLNWYFSSTMADAMDIDGGMGEETAAAKLKLYGDANIQGWAIGAEQEAIVENAKYLYAQDAKIAATAGMTLEQYYDTVYGEGNRPSVEDMLSAAVKLRQAQNDPDNLTEEEKAGIGFFGVVGNSLKLGTLGVAESDVGFVADVARLLGSEDKQHIMSMYDGMYELNGRQMYRTDLNEAINYWESTGLEADKQKADMYRQRLAELDAGGYDIYYAGFSPDQKLLDQIHSYARREVESTQQYVAENATEDEAKWIRRGSSAVTSTITNARAIAFSAATGTPLGLTSFASFFPGSFEDYYQKGQEQFGWDSTTSAKYALFGALINSASEASLTSSVYNFAGEGLAKFINDGSLKLVEKFGVDNVLANSGNAALRILGKALPRIGHAGLSYLGTALPEITQELSQNGIEGFYDYIYTAIQNGDIDAGTWNTMVDNFCKEAVMDTIWSTALSTGGSWNASQLATARNGGPSIYSKSSALQIYALTELHPELRGMYSDLLDELYRETGGGMQSEDQWNPLNTEEEEAPVQNVSFTEDISIDAEDDAIDILPAPGQQTGAPAAVPASALPPAGKAPGAPENGAASLTPEALEAEPAGQPAEEQTPETPERAMPEDKAPSAPKNAASDISIADLTGENPEGSQSAGEATFTRMFATWKSDQASRLKAAQTEADRLTAEAAALEQKYPDGMPDDISAQHASLIREADSQRSLAKSISQNLFATTADIQLRLLNMSLSLKIRDALANPEIRARMVKTVADSNTAAAINSGALTSDPDTKAAVEKRNEAQEASDEATREADEADQKANEANETLKAARAENKANPSAEAGKREVAAAKTAQKAKTDAQTKRKAANKAKKEAQKAADEAKKKLDANLQAIRDKSSAEGEATIDAAAESVNEDIKDTLDALKPENVELTEAVAPSADEQVTEVSPESAKEAADGLKGPTPADTGSYDERMNRLNPKFSVLKKGTKYDALKKAYQENEAVRNIIDAMSDEDFTGMLSDIAGKGRGLRAANIEKYVLDTYTPSNTAESINKEGAVEQPGPESPNAEAEAPEVNLDTLLEEVNALASDSATNGSPEMAVKLRDLLNGMTEKLNTAHDALVEAYDNDKISKDVVNAAYKSRKQIIKALQHAVNMMVNDQLGPKQYNSKTMQGIQKLLNDFKAGISQANQAMKAGDDAGKNRFMSTAMKAGYEFDIAANQIFNDFKRSTYRSATSTSTQGPQLDEYTPLIPSGTSKGMVRRPKAFGTKVVKTPLEAAQKLAKDLHIGLYNNTANRWRRGSQGEADRDRGTAATDTHSGNDMDVLFHELGHAIQTITGMNEVPESITSVFPSGNKPEECFAEFVKLYIEGYNQAVSLFGQDTVDDFENRLKTGRRKGAYKAVSEARLAMEEFYNADEVDRGMASISHINHVNNQEVSKSQALRDKLRKGVIGMMDDTYAAARFDSATGLIAGRRRLRDPENAFTYEPNTKANAPSTQVSGDVSTDARYAEIEDRLTIQEQAKLMKADANRANRLLMQELTTLGGRHIAEGMRQAIQLESADGKFRDMNMSEMKAFELYSVAMHSIDRAEFAEELAEKRLGRPLTAEEVETARNSKQVFNEKNFSLEEQRRYVAEIQRSHPEIAAAHARLMNWWKQFMQEYAVNAGLMTQEQMDFLNTIYPNYVPTYRDYPNAKVSEGGTGNQSLFELITGSDLNVMSPLEGMAYNVTALVERGRKNAALNTIYEQLNPDLNPNAFETGEFVREVPIPQSMNGANVLTFTDKNGKQHALEFKDLELYKLIASNATPEQAAGAARVLGKWTRTMSMLTTGSNPLFALKNAVRDFQQGVNHGTWAYTYLDGAAKWIMASARLGAEQLSQSEMLKGTKLGKLLGKADENLGLQKNRGHAAEYLALQGDDSYTGHGLAMNEKDAKDFMQIFVPGWGENRTDEAAAAIAKVKDVRDKAWHILTLNSINGWVEQTTRFAEFLYGEHGKHDLTTDVGRQRAYLDAQESTTNFQLSGNSKFASDLRKVIPFFNATLQGTYSIIHAGSEAERGKLGERIIKTVGNNILTGALAYMLLDKYGSDDDKKWYEKLADGIKFDNIVLPLSLFDRLSGETKEHARQYLRIPLTQNGFGKFWYAVGNAIMSKPDMSELKQTLLNVGAAILNDSIQTDTILNPFINVLNNKTHFGSNIVSTYLLDRSNTMQYDESTAAIFVWLAQNINTATNRHGWKWATSPKTLEYIFQQETGFIGKLLMPMLSGNRATGYNKDLESVGWNLWNTFYNDWTIDAAYSNDIGDDYSRAKEDLSSLIKDVNDLGRSDVLDFGLTEEQQKEATNQANYLMGPTGPITRIDKQISTYYKQINAIYDDDNLEPDQKLIQARDIMKQADELKEEGIALYKDFASKYMGRYYPMEAAVYGKLTEKGELKRSSVYGFPVLSGAEGNKDYPGINNLLTVYNSMENPDSTFNPCPSTSIKLSDDPSEDKKSIPVYSLDETGFKLYQETYLETLEAAMLTKNPIWESMTYEQQKEAARKAKSKANKEAQNAVVRYLVNNNLVNTAKVTGGN